MNIDGDSFLYHPFKIFHKIQRNYGKVMISPYNWLVKGHRGHTLALDLWSLTLEIICLFVASVFHTFASWCYSPSSSIGLHVPFSSSRDPGEGGSEGMLQGCTPASNYRQSSPASFPRLFSCSLFCCSQSTVTELLGPSTFLIFYIPQYSMKNT